MSRASRSVASLAGVAALFLAGVAHAEPTAQDKALAETLFRDGRALMTSGKTAEACAKLADSHHLDPQVGTLLNLALCHEAQGKTASAWAELVEVNDQAGRANDTQRATFARKHADELEKKLSTVRLKPEKPGPNDRVVVGGRVIVASAIGAPFPVDPGEQDVEVSAPGKVSWKKRVRIPAGPSTTEIPLPALVDEASAAAKPPVGPVDPPPAEPSSGSGRRIAGFVIGGVGLVGIGVGTVFGLQTLSKKSDADKECPLDRCSDEGKTLDEDAKSSAVLSTVGFGVGIVGLAVGAYLVFTSKSSSSAALSVSPTFGLSNGAQVQGRF